MLKQLVTKVIGTRFDRELRHIQPIIDSIHEHESRLGKLADDQIRAQTEKFRSLLRERLGGLESELARTREAKHGCADPREREDLDRTVQQLEERLKRETAKALGEILPEAFATVREACRRLLGSTVVVTGH
ncbi:MAG: hypothetical protein HY560_01605, partial [Gemmatimonadetes bacterium]|nr:hypothetical protein [Gemmatimonadota bacterium]